MGDRKHDIERYLRGELSGEEMHALENEALNDPFLAEALEGIEQAGPDNFLYDLHQIRRSVHDRLHRDSRKKSKQIRIWAWTGAIAATLLLIGISGFIVLSLIREQVARQQALNAEPEPMPVEFLKKDTLVIGLPAESPVRSRVEARSAVTPTSTAGATSDQSKSLIAEADEQASEHVADDEQESIRKTPDGDVARDQVSQVNEDIAALNRPDAAERTSDIVEREEQQPVSGIKKESQRELAASQRSASSRPPAADMSLLVKGKVVDAGGEPLPGVNVIIKDTNTGTVTNADGRYELRVPSGKSHVVFMFVGYQSQEVAIGEREELNIALTEEMTSLSEVIVTGYSSPGDTKEHSTFVFAEPTGGRNDFNAYLERSVSYPAEAVKNKAEGRVTIRFTVEPNGELTNFEVIKGIGSGAEEALINAIKAGPAWKPSMQGDHPVADEVKVRYRFKLPD